MHIDTLQTGIIGYMENPITTVKPSLYKVIDLNTLILSVVHTYLLEITEPSIVHYQDMKRINNFFEVNHMDMNEDQILNNAVCNVKPSKNLAPRVLAVLPYSSESLQLLKKLLFRYSDLLDSEDIQLCKILVEKNYSYVTHRNCYTLMLHMLQNPYSILD